MTEQHYPHTVVDFLYDLLYVLARLEFGKGLGSAMTERNRVIDSKMGSYEELRCFQLSCPTQYIRHVPM